MKFKVQWKYYSSMGGPWEADDNVDLDEDHAAMINRDSPGVLREVKQTSAPKSDRQVKKAETRKLDRQGDPSDQGAIDKSTFKAVKDGD